jgi:signal transduction histidine kinase
MTPTERLPRCRFWPGSLFGRIALILFTGLAAAHVLSLGLLLYDRVQTVSAMMIAYLAKDVASSIAILERVPADERTQWLAKIDRRNYHYRFVAAADDQPLQSSTAQNVAAMVSRELGPGRAVKAVAVPGASDPLRFDLRLALRDGTPLTLELIPPDTGLSGWVLAALAFQLGVLAVFTWVAVRVATQPLAQLAEAAEKLRPDLRAPRLPETGPREVARASIAFNAMQHRIAEHLAERTRILAAISHDLQSPITRMRLRTDLLEDFALKRKLQADLAAMQTLIEQGIDLARSAGSGTEPFVATDVQALIESLVYDYADAGQHVDLVGRIDRPIVTAPQALRRILTNLLDNALKFGGEVDIAAEAGVADRILIAVRDRGPGIPETQLDSVLAPFYRLEGSRNRKTGGAGLGLAIASQLATALGGELAIANRAGGGLTAQLTLPARSQSRP